jgi:hypothetical protein
LLRSSTRFGFRSEESSPFYSLESGGILKRWRSQSLAEKPSHRIGDAGKPSLRSF